MTRSDPIPDTPAIPGDVALQICAQIREERRRHPWSFAALQCWGCLKFSNGDPAKMCLNSRPGYRGCGLVNARYDRHHSASAPNGTQ